MNLTSSMRFLITTFKNSTQLPEEADQKENKTSTKNLINDISDENSNYSLNESSIQRNKIYFRFDWNSA